MSDGTPWGHLKLCHIQQSYFEEALPGLNAHGLTGDDVVVLLNSPSSELEEWVRFGAGHEVVSLTSLEPPADAVLPPRREGGGGFFARLFGTHGGVRRFTDADVFGLGNVHFAVLPEERQPVAFGDVVTIRLVVLNCRIGVATLRVQIDAAPGVVQSVRSYDLTLEPGVTSMATLPIRVCSRDQRAQLVPLFSTNVGRDRPRWRFRAQPYNRPGLDLVSTVVEVASVAAGRHSPVGLAVDSLTGNGGSPEPIRLSVDLARPIVAAERPAASLWSLERLEAPR